MTSTLDDLDEVQQLEREAEQAARQAEQLNRRLEAARQRKRERIQRSQGRRSIVASDIHTTSMEVQETSRSDSNTSCLHPSPEPSQRHTRKGKKGGKGPSRCGRSKTIPASAQLRVTNGAPPMKKTKAKDKAGVAPPWLRSFLEQPRRTRSQKSRIFYELGEQSRGVNAQPRRSQRSGRSW